MTRQGVPLIELRAARKPKRRSKVMWFNAIVLVLLALEASWHLLQPVLPVSVYLVAAFVLGVVNMVLRQFTTCGVRGWRPEAPKSTEGGVQ